MKDNKYMNIAIKEAKKAYKHNEVPVGAVIVENDKIIAKAYNKKDKTKIVTKHAEIIAIEKACRKNKNWRLNNCSIYITLKPCCMCAGAINQARFKKVVYGTCTNNESKLMIDDIFKQDNLNISIKGGVLENECANLMKNFFTTRR